MSALPALLLVGASAWEIVATRRAAASAPDDDAWGAAAAVVRADHRAGDLIVFAPDWIDPVGRLHLGDLIPVDAAARMDAARYGRIWELSIRGARAADTLGLVAVAETTAGGVTVRRFERAPAVVLGDAVAALATARVDAAGVRAPAVVLAEVGFAPHRCVELVAARGKPARVTFPRFALGRELVGYAGIADVFTRRDDRAPGRLDLSLDGKPVAQVQLGVDDGWVRFAAPTTPGAGELAIVATSDAGRARQICFAVEARR